MKKRIMLFIAAVVMVLPLALGLGSSLKAEAADPVEVDITLHKKRYNKTQTAVENTGEEMAHFADAEGFGGVEFKVYNVTKEFYELLNKEKTPGGPKYTVTEAITELKTKDYTGTPVATGTTAEADNSANGVKIGDLKFPKLDAKTDGQNSVYIFVETEQTGVTIAEKMVVALPVQKSDNSGVLTDIHLYPKNIVGLGSVEVEKISNVNAAGKPVAPGTAGTVPVKDAAFVIHTGGKYGATGTKYFKGFDTTTNAPIWTDDINAAEPQTTPASGKFKVEGLPLYATYYLTEVSVLEHAIQKGAIDLEFYLDGDNPAKAFTGTSAIVNDDIKVDKSNTGGSVNVGDKISYTVTSVIPTGIADVLADGSQRYKKYVITDTHGKHLKLDKSSPTEPPLSITDGTTTFLPTDYTLDDTTTEGVFTVTFKPEVIKLMKPNATLTIKYKMELLETVDPGVEVVNDAKIDTDYDFGNDPGEKNYTGGYNFIKIDGSNNNTALKGAKFVVREADSDTSRYLKVGDNGEISWVTTLAEAESFESDAKGYVTIKGLKNGTYFLEETQAPNDKYVELASRVPFTVTKDSFNTTNPIIDPDDRDADDPEKPTKVVNLQEGKLPSTGGTGIYVMMALGAVVMGAAGLWYVRSQRKEA